MNSRGKKVLDVEWKGDGITIKVPVKAYMSKSLNGTWQDTEIMKFRAEYKDAGVDVEGTDINKVRDEVIAALSSWYTIKWELYFGVEISGGPSGQEGLGRSIHFKMEFYVIGKDVRGKQRHMRIPRPDLKQIKSFDGKPTQWGGVEPVDGMPEIGERMRQEASYRRDATTRSLVRATPENVAAAEHFMGAMDALLEKMHHHFAPDRIEQLLQNVGMLLPAPKKGATS